MRVAQEMIGKPIISVEEGQELGKVQDFYLNRDLTELAAVYLGSEGLLSRKESLIKWSDVEKLGQDAILVKDAGCVIEAPDASEGIESYIRRDEIRDRPVDTPGGTNIGHVGDVVLDDGAKIAGFSLSQTFVSGPIAENRAISRAAVVDTGNEDGVMTADLSEAERANLQVAYEGLFARPSVSQAEPQ